MYQEAILVLSLVFVLARYYFHSLFLVSFMNHQDYLEVQLQEAALASFVTELKDLPCCWPHNYSVILNKSMKACY